MMPKTRKSSIYDVAAVAQVSAKTVSRVVNGSSHVSEDTRKRVEDAVRQLDFRLNPVAQSLRSGTDASVGIIVESLTDPFFGSLTSGAQHVVQGSERAMLLASTEGRIGRERQLVEAFVRRRAAGVLLVPLDDDQTYLDEIASDLPVVFVDRHGSGAARDTVVIDDEQAAFDATSHLLDSGHTRIALIGDLEQVSSAGSRERGYRRALQQIGLDPDDALIFHRGTSEAAAEAVQEAIRLPEPATAVLASNAKATLGVVPSLHASGDADIAIVCFGDVPMAGAITPALTVVDQDPVDMGRVASELLAERISGLDSPARIVVLPTRLIVRGSGELPPRRR